MTAQAARSLGLWARLSGGVMVALAGRETRYVGRLYAGRIVLFAVLVLTVVLSLDAANHIGGFLGGEDQPGAPSGFQRLLYYLMLRGGYNVPAILPLAALTGVIWAEFALARSRQRMMIANSGRSILMSLAPAVLVGLAVGLVQFGALAYLRPLAVEVQATETFRYFGPKFQLEQTGRMWLSVDNAVIETRIGFTDPVELRDAVIYELSDDGALRTILTAKRAVPDGQGHWTLENGTMWQVPGFSTDARSATPSHGANAFAERNLALELDPLWVENIDILPTLLPQDVLTRLGTAQTGIQNISTYEAALNERFAAIFYVMGMMVLPAALGIAWFSPGMSAGPLIRTIIWGMGAYVAASIVSMLGSYGYLPPLLSAWLAPTLFFLIALGIVAARSPRQGD